jgi:hypothetical protein
VISGIVAEDIAIQKKSSEKKLEKVSSKYVKVPSSHLVKIGDPIDEIIDAAQKCKSQLIVMGTHGASGLKRILFGSNTSNVISKSNIPVLAIPQRYRFKKINSIVYATDLNNTLYEPIYGVSIRNKNAIIFQLGLRYKGLVFRASYDVITNNYLREYRNQGLEFSFVCTLGKKGQGRKKSKENNLKSSSEVDNL